MKILLIRTALGTYMGEVEREELEPPQVKILHNPVMIDFITMPVQGRVGGQGMITITNVAAWPSNQLQIIDILSAISSIMNTELDADNKLMKLYLECVKNNFKKPTLTS